MSDDDEGERNRFAGRLVFAVRVADTHRTALAERKQLNPWRHMKGVDLPREDVEWAGRVGEATYPPQKPRPPHPDPDIEEWLAKVDREADAEGKSQPSPRS